MSELAKALKATFTKQELRALVTETGTMGSPELIILAREIHQAIDMYTGDEIRGIFALRANLPQMAIES